MTITVVQNNIPSMYTRFSAIERNLYRYVQYALLVFALCIVFPASLLSQWIVKSAPEFDGGAVRTLTEVHCSTATMILAGTTEGIYLDLTGKAVYGQWIPANQGLPISFREIRTIVVKDSIVFAGIYGDGVYATIISPFNVPFCRPRPWVRFGSKLNMPFVHDLELRDSLLFAATDEGVWFIRPILDTALTFEQNADTLVWEKLDDSFSERTLALDDDPNYLFAGTFLNGAYYYDPNCTGKPSCLWLEGTPYPEFENISVYDVKAAKLDTTLQISEGHTTPCNGVFIATGGSDNLFFAPYLSESLPTPPDKWINVSPTNSNPKWNWKINTILAGNFPGAPHALLVGAEFGGVFISEDCGQTWREANTATNGSGGLRGTDVRTLALIGDSLILAGIDGAGIFQGNTFAQSTARSLRQLVATSVAQKTTDTTKRDPQFRITVDANGERATIKTDFPEEKESVEIAVYNLLAKKVLDVDKHSIGTNREEISFPVSSLPRGMYICVIQGRDFRLAQKFVIVR